MDARGAIIDLGDASRASCAPPNWAATASKTRVPCSRWARKSKRVHRRRPQARTISLSIKAKEMHEEAEAVSELPLRVGQLVGHEPGRPAQGAHRVRRRPLSPHDEVGSSSRSSPPSRSICRPAKDVELALKQILEIMSDALSQAGERIEIRGFGSFSLHFRPPRQGRNPKTGEAVALSGKHVPHFKPGKDLRERVNDGARSPDPRLRLKQPRGAGLSRGAARLSLPHIT